MNGSNNIPYRGRTSSTTTMGSFRVDERASRQQQALSDQDERVQRQRAALNNPNTNNSRSGTRVPNSNTRAVNAITTTQSSLPSHLNPSTSFGDFVRVSAAPYSLLPGEYYTGAVCGYIRSIEPSRNQFVLEDDTVWRINSDDFNVSSWKQGDSVTVRKVGAGYQFIGPKPQSNNDQIVAIRAPANRDASDITTIFR